MDFKVYEGVALESRKHYQSHGNGISATLHQEFWLKFADGSEQRFDLLHCDIPIRTNNRVAVVYRDDQLAAVINRTTCRHLAFPPSVPSGTAPPSAPVVSGWRQFLTLFVPALVAVLISVPLLYESSGLGHSAREAVLAILLPLIIVMSLAGVRWLKAPQRKQAQQYQQAFAVFEQRLAEEHAAFERELATFHREIAALSESRSAA